MKKIIFEIIEKHSPIKREKLLAELQHGHYSMFHKMSDRKMRRTIEEMITQDGYLIASGEKGYYIIRNSGHLLDAQRYLTAKAYPLFNRASSLHASFFKGENAQLSIEEFLQKS